MAHSKSSQSTQSPDPDRNRFAGLRVVIHKTGNVLRLMGENNTPLPPELIKAVTRGLQYSHVEQLHG